MLKVMLVDDEAIEREGIRLILSRNRDNLEIVAEAQNGKIAVEKALDTEPDIIFMDIKMPDLDGLKATQKILNQLPHAKCVMVSAFDTFQYAQEAMKYGVKEYLLKPSKVQEVLDAFDRMAAEVEEEKEQMQEKQDIEQRLERASSLVEMDFVISLMMDHVHDFNQDDWNDWLDLDDQQGFAAVFYFQAEERKPDREQKTQWYQTLKRALATQPYPYFVGPLIGFQIPVFVKYQADNTGLTERENFARLMIRTMQHQLDNCQLCVGIGSVVANFQHFSKSYEQAIYTLEMVEKRSGSAYLVYSKQLEDKRKNFVPFDLEKDLLEAVKNGDTRKGLEVFEAYFQWIQKSVNYQIELIQKAMENLFIVLTRATKEFGFGEDVQMNFHPYETAMQVKQAAKAHLQTVMEEINKWRTNGVQGILIQVKGYLDSHYQDAVSLEGIAEKVGLSSYYLSKLFKEHFGVTFVEYLTNIRIQKAKDFLLDGSKPLKEIALDIGYKDPNYFSRVFKKEVGLSPSEYRNKYI
ncbi:response regulator transcription factor [Gracilibacillus dipsosauri]|uniref:DNA-binding response regulator n=1 Tax=Gracilibacillus dipsosauri TaxID=178340 RepID=A0A317L5S9_9BACI|nr:helix-turn-helix domain-containing protein [Gracilibacillus dipsosauri]PWU70310.1 DNA-binding response regulator [Gracilibacillus dipsosauri]